MVLTFTSSISVAESGHAETREVLVAALGCNVAWGIVDAAFYLMSSVIGRARGLQILHARVDAAMRTPAADIRNE